LVAAIPIALAFGFAQLADRQIRTAPALAVAA